MRELNIGTKRRTTVFAVDEPGQGNANHEYHVSWDRDNNGYISTQSIKFQQGPIKEAGVNGVADVDLLAICIDRLEGFQSGDYKCDTNQTALQHLLDAVTALDSRTKERETRGVEGTNEK